LFVLLNVSSIFNDGAYLPIFHKALKDGIFAILRNFENLERASVSFIMLSAKQGYIHLVKKLLRAFLGGSLIIRLIKIPT